MNMSFSHRFFIIFILLLSLELHIVGIWHPQEAVFDEVHFGKFVSGYLTGQYFFDIHPPLGKLAIAGIAKIVGFTPGFDFLTIGEQYPNYQYIWLRFLPALFGSLLAPLIYLLTLRISHSIWASRMAGLFIVFENALLVQSKFILIDSFLLFFGFAALYFFVESTVFFSEGRWGLWSCGAASLCAGLAISVKWTAASFLGLILVFGFWLLIKKIIAFLWQWNAPRVLIKKGIITRARSRSNERDTVSKIITMCLGYAMFLVIPSLIYIFLFAIHLELLPKKGSGNAYMSARFGQSQAAGFPLRDFPANFYELNLEMFRANQRITTMHSYSSKWYTWPFMLRPVYYWNKDITIGATTWYEKIYLLGNPFVWWLSTLTVAYFFVSIMCKACMIAFSHIRKKHTNVLEKHRGKPVSMYMTLFLSAGYLVNLLPFIFIGRVMFLYHYLTALVIAIMITAIMITSDQKPRKLFLGFLMLGTMVGFFVVFPISYGTILNSAWPRSVFLLTSWI